MIAPSAAESITSDIGRHRWRNESVIRLLFLSLSGFEGSQCAYAADDRGALFLHFQSSLLRYEVPGVECRRGRIGNSCLQSSVLDSGGVAA